MVSRPGYAIGDAYCGQMKMSRLATLATAAVLVVTACTGATDSDPSTSVSAPVTTATSSTTTTTTFAPDVTAPITAPGRLAVVDNRGSVVVMAPDGTDRHTLATVDDATGYRQPTWAPTGGRLAYAELSAGAAFVTTNGVDGVERRYRTADLPFYFYWSPDARHLAFLHNSPEGLTFELVEDADGASPRIVALGAPFYFSWEPGGADLAVHVSDGPLEMIRGVAAGGEIESLDQPVGSFSAPHWTPAGIGYVTDADAEHELRTLSPDGDSVVLAVAELPFRFNFSPDGSQVAVLVGGETTGVDASFGGPPRLLPGTMYVINVATGEPRRLDVDRAVAFFWAPDSTKLIVLSVNGERNGVRWSLWRQDGSMHRFEDFRIAPPFINELLPFFDQYAQSLQLWAPDSSAFAYPGIHSARGGIWV